MDLLKKIFKGDKIVWMIFLLLCLISIVEVFSSTSKLTYRSGNYWEPFTQHTAFLLGGAAVVILVHRMKYIQFKKLGALFYPVSIILLAILLFAGIFSDGATYTNGAARWLSVGGINFQPSEFAKLTVVIGVATLLARMKDTDEENKLTFRSILIITGIALLLIAPENMSTALLLGGTVFLMMILGGIAMKRIALLVGSGFLGVAVIALIMLIVPTQTLSEAPGLHRLATWKTRIETFIGDGDKQKSGHDFENNGQTGHACIAIMSSHGIGRGPGNSVQRDFLDLAFSDFIFAIIVEELGIVGAIVVVFLYILLLIRVGKISKKCTHAFPVYLIMGISILMVSQAMMNMMVAVGLFPVTGQPLPLISKGGTSILVNCIYIGMILSVSRDANEQEMLRKEQEMATNAPVAVATELSQEEEEGEDEKDTIE